MYNMKNLNMLKEGDGLAPQLTNTLPRPRWSGPDIPASNPHSNPQHDMISDLDPAIIHNLDTVKARQKATWECGDFGQIARTVENVAEEFMARRPLRPGSQVLDLACGTGNLALIA